MGFVKKLCAGRPTLRTTFDSKAGMILHNHVSPTGGKSRELLPALLATMRVLGVPQLLRALADMGYAGEPNLKLIGKEHVHELLIPQAKRATKSALVREQEALNARRVYWLKRRGRIEATNGRRGGGRLAGAGHQGHPARKGCPRGAPAIKKPRIAAGLKPLVPAVGLEPTLHC